MRLKDKVAIVTGAARGLGKGIAKKLAEEGAKVVIADMAGAEEAAAEINQEGGTASAFQVNVSKQSEMQALVQYAVDTYGTLDIMVNNAGITDTKPLLYMKDEDFTRLLEVDLTGAFRCIRAAAAAMEKRGGSIINTGSMVGLYGGRHQAAYSAAKAGLHGLTRACAKELGPMGIRVNAVAPGVVLTDMVTKAVTGQQLEALRRLTPLGRAATPAELAGAYIYLASDESRFTTGAIIQVDGGLLL